MKYSAKGLCILKTRTGGVVMEEVPHPIQIHETPGGLVNMTASTHPLLSTNTANATFGGTSMVTTATVLCESHQNAMRARGMPNNGASRPASSMPFNDVQGGQGDQQACAFSIVIV